MANKANSFLRFLGESAACPICFWFYLTFILNLCNYALLERANQVLSYQEGVSSTMTKVEIAKDIHLQM